MTRLLRIVAGVCIVLAFQIHPAFADRIVGVTATTTMGSGFGTSLINTVNGNGLLAPTLTAPHAGTIPGNSWVSAGPLTGTVTFALGATYEVDSFSFWNQNAGGPGANGSTGIQGVQVLTSTDGISFVLLPGGPSSFAQVPVVGALPQIFTFAAVTATHLRFNILSNYGDPAGTGFAEVGFNSVSAPEPASVGLLICGLSLIALVRHSAKRGTMKPILRIPTLLGFVVLSAAAAQATTLTFENVAPAGGVTNVNPAAPYNEQGYTISVINALAAVVDSASPAFNMPGNLTDFFGFAELNTPTLTFTGGTFDLVSLLIGPTSIGPPPASITLTGTLAGGGTLTASFPGLLTATEATLNWSGLQSVSFAATNDAGLDNIVVNASQVPESGSLILLALGVAGVAIANMRLRRG